MGADESKPLGAFDSSRTNISGYNDNSAPPDEAKGTGRQ